MLTTIQLQTESRFGAVEIEEVWADRMLPAELVAGEPPVPQQPPQAALGVRHRLPQTACAREILHRRHCATAGPGKRGTNLLEPGCLPTGVCSPLTPHPSPLPVEGRGSNAGRAWWSDAARHVRDWPLDGAAVAAADAGAGGLYVAVLQPAVATACAGAICLPAARRKGARRHVVRAAQAGLPAGRQGVVANGLGPCDPRRQQLERLERQRQELPVSEPQQQRPGQQEQQPRFPGRAGPSSIPRGAYAST